MRESPFQLLDLLHVIYETDCRMEVTLPFPLAREKQLKFETLKIYYQCEFDPSTETYR